MIIFTIILLAIMEVSLSVDNAVVNAAVLRHMPAIWRRRFLVWGMPVAVFGMRLVFPALIVAIASDIPIFKVVNMAIYDGDAYAWHVLEAHTVIASFGGIFLLLVFLQFMCDVAKGFHWIGPIERGLVHVGKLTAAPVAICLILLLFITNVSIIAGLTGVICFLLIKGTTGLYGDITSSGLMGFIYLEVVDASFSLDGVIGAFAITNNIIAIMIGLGIGALVIRSMTVQLVKRGTLEQYVYLEHGAHWGIGALGVIMLISINVDVPEIITGLIGVGMIGLSLLSSVRYNCRI